MTVRERLRFESTDESHRVTSLELFFDLVFVYALTQVTSLLAADTTWLGVARGVVVMCLLWFPWCAYAWLGNQAKADEGLLRAAMLAAMGAPLERAAPRRGRSLARAAAGRRAAAAH